MCLSVVMQTREEQDAETWYVRGYATCPPSKQDCSYVDLNSVKVD